MSITRASDGSDRELRLKFVLVSEETGALLRDFWNILEPRLGSVLDGFYAHVRAMPHLAKMLGNDVPRLKSAQRQHWERLLSGRFDDTYMQRVRTIGLTHNHIGLEPRWYIGGYNFVLRQLIGIATKAHKWSPSRTAAATREIARNVQQAAASTTEVSSNIAGITQVATETRGAAENVMQAATGLSQETQGLKSEVERFFAAMRAA